MSVTSVSSSSASSSASTTPYSSDQTTSDIRGIREPKIYYWCMYQGKYQEVEIRLIGSGKNMSYEIVGPAGKKLGVS